MGQTKRAKAAAARVRHEHEFASVGGHACGNG